MMTLASCSREDDYLCFVTSAGLITDVHTISNAPTEGKKHL